MSQDNLRAKRRKIIAEVSPELVARLVRELEPQQHPANRGSVAINQIMDAILAQAGYAVEERAAFEKPLKKAIVQAAEHIPGMEFIDGG